MPAHGKLEIELAGALAGILALTNKQPPPVRAGAQVTLVAGIGFTAFTALGVDARLLADASQGSVRTTGSFTDPSKQKGLGIPIGDREAFGCGDRI